MMRAGSRLRQIGWALALAICLTLFLALTFRVNAVKSDVRLAERKIIALEREKLLLETEFETRANQQQLANLNRIEFGYQAPKANQYLEGERQLASLGTPRRADAPDPIRVARAPIPNDKGLFPMMVSPLTGEPVAGEGIEDSAPVEESEGRQELSAPRSLAQRLAISNPLEGPIAEVSE